MILDLILALLAIASLGVVGYLVFSKWPLLSNINVDATPERKQTTIKRQILEDKLKRDFQRRWSSLHDAVLAEPKAKVVQAFSGVVGRMRELEQEYRRKAKQDLGSHLSKTQTIEEIIVQAREQISEENYSKAEQLLLDGLKEDEHNVRVYTMLAQVYKAQGDYDHAKETLEYILKLTNQDDAGIYHNLADLARERGDLFTAQEDYLKSISLDPENYKHHLELAEVLAIQEHFKESLDAAQKALMLAPNNPKILDFLIETSIILQDKNRAEEYLDKLVEVNPQNGKIPAFKQRIEELSS